MRHRGVPRAGGHRLSARGPRAQAAVRRRQPRPPSPSGRGTPGAAPPCVGFVDADHDLFNAAAICGGGRGRSAPTTSALLPNYGVFDEAATSRRATRPTTELLRDRRRQVGISICEDIWSPDGPLAEQAAGGAELVVNINASPYHLGRRRTASGCSPPGPPTRTRALVYVNQVGGQDELVFDGCSLVFDADGDAARPRSPVRRGRCSSSTCRSPRSTASACSTRAVASRRRRCRSSRCSTEPGRAGRRPVADPLATPLDPIAEVYEALVLGTARLRAEERVHRRRDRPVRRHRLDAGRGASPSTPSAPSTCTACRCRRGTRRTTPGPTPPTLAANLGIDYRTISIEPAFAGLPRHAGAALRRPPAGPDRGEPPEPLPRQAADGAVQRVRLDGAHHRQQERDGGRLLHPVRRLGRRLRGHQGRAQDCGSTTLCRYVNERAGAR